MTLYRYVALVALLPAAAGAQARQLHAYLRVPKAAAVRQVQLVLNDCGLQASSAGDTVNALGMDGFTKLRYRVAVFANDSSSSRVDMEAFRELPLGSAMPGAEVRVTPGPDSVAQRTWARLWRLRAAIASYTGEQQRGTITPSCVLADSLARRDTAPYRPY